MLLLFIKTKLARIALNFFRVRNEKRNQRPVSSENNHKAPLEEVDYTKDTKHNNSI